MLRWRGRPLQAVDETLDREKVAGSGVPAGIRFRALGLGEDGTAFRTLNEEWISRYFVLEKKDI